MIKSLSINILIVALAVLLQSTLLSFIAIYDIIPDLVLVIVLFMSLKEGSLKGEITGFAGGIFVDFLSLAPLGFHSIIYGLIGFISGLTQKNVSTESILTQFLFIFISMICKYLVSSLIIVVFSVETTSFMLMGRHFFLELAYTMLITPLIFAMANRVYSATHKKRVGL